MDWWKDWLGEGYGQYVVWVNLVRLYQRVGYGQDWSSSSEYGTVADHIVGLTIITHQHHKSWCFDPLEMGSTVVTYIQSCMMLRADD